MAFHHRSFIHRIAPSILVGIVIMAFVGIYLLFLGAKDPRDTDLAIYVAAADRLRAGEGLYFERTNPTPIDQQYLYPPLLAQFFLLFPSLHTAWWGWGLLSLGAFGGALWIIIRTVNLRAKVPSTRSWLLTILAILAFPPLFYHLAWGQVQLVLLGLLTGVWYCLRKNRNILAGVFLSLSILLKIYPAIWLIPLVIQRRWRTVLSTVVITTGLAILSFWWAGWSESSILLHHVLPAVNHDLSAELYIDYYSMRATVVLLGVSPTVAAVVDLVYRITIGIIFVTVLLRAPIQPDGVTAYAMTAMLLISPVIWSHYFVLLYLPILTSWARSTSRHPYAIGGLYFALSLPPIIHSLNELPGMTMALLHIIPTAGLAGLFLWQSQQVLIRAAGDGITNERDGTNV